MPLFHGAVETHFPDLKLKEMVHFSLCTEIGQEDKWKASKCLSMQWEKYWNKIEFPRFRPVLVAPQIDRSPCKEIRTAARKSIFLFEGTDRNSDGCFDIFLKISGSLPDQVSSQLHTGRSLLNGRNLNQETICSIMINTNVMIAYGKRKIHKIIFYRWIKCSLPPQPFGMCTWALHLGFL